MGELHVKNQISSLLRKIKHTGCTLGGHTEPLGNLAAIDRSGDYPLEGYLSSRIILPSRPSLSLMLLFLL